MIVMTEAYAAAAAVGANNARIGYQSHIRDLALTSSAITVSSEVAEGPRDSPIRESTEDFWEPASLPATWEIAFGEFVDVNYIGILGYNLDGVQITVETADGSSAGSPSAPAFQAFATDIIASDDSPVMFLDTVRSCNRMRLSLANSGSVVDMPKIASIYVGEVLEMQRPVYGGVAPMNMSRNTVLYSALSQGGQLLAQGFRRHGQNGALVFQHLTAAWVRQNFDPFIKHARNRPFFIGWRPQTFPREVAYAWCGSDLRPANMGKRDFMQVQLPMMGIGFE